MKKEKILKVNLKNETFTFYNAIAKELNCSIEKILSDTLYKYAEIVVREVNNEHHSR